MKLLDLTRNMPEEYAIFGDENTIVTSLCTDSRKVKEGCLFFCISGLHFDAHLFAEEAVAKGARALVVEHRVDADCPQILVKNVRFAMSYIAANFYGNPAEKLTMIGITGTKGKTTTSFLVKSILESAGHKVGLIGTVCTLIGNEQRSAGKTTPDPVEFQEILADMVNADVTHVVMEVSAHALSMHRIAGVRFAAAAFTNFSQDHLDFYKTMDAYLEAKLMIFAQSEKLCVNQDDEKIAHAVKERGYEYTRIGIRELADVYAKEIEFTEKGLSFTLCFHKRMRETVNMHMTGIFNVYNALVAATLCDLVGVPLKYIKDGLEKQKGVPGRIELLETKTPYRVILDYAHSPDALENILKAVRETSKGRLISLFGCGGGRDQMKRPIMGEISGRMADISIITSDNPRDEEPLSIISAIVEGIEPTGGEYIVIENRREAIKYALSIARESDSVVLAGKGHETYQEIKGVKLPFDEKSVVREILEEAGVK